MKTNLFQILGVVAIGVLSFSSCTTDACKDVNCGTNGTCLDGDCICDAGYEGLNCETEERAKFLKAWTTTDDCTNSGQPSYVVTINAGTAINEVRLTNFWNEFNAAVLATVNGSSIIIATQDPDDDGFEVTGSGSLNANGTITWTYTIDDTNDVSTGTDVCSSSWE